MVLVILSGPAFSNVDQVEIVLEIRSFLCCDTAVRWVGVCIDRMRKCFVAVFAQ